MKNKPKKSTSEYIAIRKMLSFKEYVEFLFWERTEKAIGDECWVWKGTLDKRGYGVVMITHPSSQRRKNFFAHRLSYWLFCHGSIKKLCVCHRCDNPPCVNPDHLFLGSRKDNAVDKVNKGRQLKGEQIHRSKLTEKDVSKLHRMYIEEGRKQQELAEHFGISISTIRGILHKRCWAHVDFDEAPNRVNRGEQHHAAKLDDNTVEKIRELYESGSSQTGLAKKFGVCQATIYYIVHRKTWTHV